MNNLDLNQECQFSFAINDWGEKILRVPMCTLKIIGQLYKNGQSFYSATNGNVIIESLSHLIVWESQFMKQLMYLKYFRNS